MIRADEWNWFGESAHFVCGRWCRFHLATQIGDYLVSTVGKYVHPRNSGGSERTEAGWIMEHPDGEELGASRHYETMVFLAGPSCTKEGCDCGMPTLADASELEARGYATAGEATRGHLLMCMKVSLWEAIRA